MTFPNPPSNEKPSIRTTFHYHFRFKVAIKHETVSHVDAQNTPKPLREQA